MAFVLGLTGSFGSGKSTVAALLAEQGAAVIDADAIARQLVEPGSALLPELAREFGAQVLAEDGSLRRGELARVAFASPEATRRLNALVHPRVRAEELHRLETLRGERLVVLDVPLLFEAGMDDLCDRVLVVVINEAQRFLRLRGRGFSEREVIERLARQWPQSRKAALADDVIDNSGTLKQTRQHLIEWIDRLGIGPAPTPGADR